MFSQLSDGLEGVFKKLKGQGKISEKNISDAMREIRMSLLEADVDFSVAKEFIAKVKEEALGEKVLKSITPGQQVVKVFQDALVDLLGGDAAPLDLNPPARIVMCGLNGAGKTTLMNIIFGHYLADNGTILFNGNELKSGDPKVAINAGIGMVHQHFTLAENLTVLENTLVGTQALY